VRGIDRIDGPAKRYETLDEARDAVLLGERRFDVARYTTAPRLNIDF
jgi:hypothetical protein